MSTSTNTSSDGRWPWLRLYTVVEPTWRRFIFSVAIVVVIVFLRAPHTRVPNALFVSDGFGYYIYLPSVVIDRDLDLSNQVTRLPYEGEKRFFHVSPRTGRRTNQFPVGSAILWAPFFVLADWGVQLVSFVSDGFPRNGFGFAYELPVYIGAFIYGFAGACLTLRMLRTLFPSPIATTSLFAVVFATPLAYYCWVEPNMSHSVAMFCVSLWLWYLCRVYQRGDRSFFGWAVLGVLLGVVALIRPYNGVLGLVAIPVAFAVCRDDAKRAFERNTWAPAFARLAICCGLAILVMSPQFATWRWLYGEWFVVPRGSGYENMAFREASIWSYLSTVFLFSPLIGLGIVGLLAGFSRNRRSDDRNTTIFPKFDMPQGTAVDRSFAIATAPWMLLVLVVVSVIILTSRDWNLGTAFGQRRLVDWSAFLAVGFGLLLSAAEHKPTLAKAAAWTVLVLAVAHSLMAAVYLAKPDWLPQYGILF